MPKLTIKRFAEVLKSLPEDMGKAMNMAAYETAKAAVPEVKRQIRGASTSEGSYPLVNTRKMLLSTRAVRGSAQKRGRRVAAEVGSYTSYADVMELGAGPHTPPLEPLIEWARHKVKRISRVGRDRASKIKSAAKSSGQVKRGPKGSPKLSSKGERQARSLAYMVQQKIKRKGIEPRFFMLKSMPKVHWHLKRKTLASMKPLGKKYPIRVKIRRVS